MGSLTDTQNSIDTRNIAITRVGIKDFTIPVQLLSKTGIQHSIATVSMYTQLEGKYRGTHMSRFITLICENKQPINAATMRELTTNMCHRLEAKGGEIILQAPLFIEKKAPVTQITSLINYEIIYHTRIRDEKIEQFLEVKIPTTSLCPCSKEISDYGAHNQRSIVNILVQYNHDIIPEILIEIAEKSSSCELYSILKRPDEKYVTEKAYENPKFVEDIVRDIYQLLSKQTEIISFKISSENFESIHNHSAYAEIVS
ncbi:MAG: GTP cyclohydrolase I FolE2 [Neisseriaceae bacterium]|nr:MAG: GTP cyclohydrolase I FolE2 [Neisseriaceae bacterium]